MLEKWKNKLSPMGQKCIDEQAPTSFRWMASMGKIPLSPSDSVIVFYLLSEDVDPKVQEAAQQSFKALPEHFLHHFLQSPETESSLLHHFAMELQERQNILEAIVLHSNTSTETLLSLADNLQGKALNALIQKQSRFEQYPELLQKTLQNPDLPPHEKARLLELSVRRDVDTGLEKEEIQDVLGDLSWAMPKEWMDESFLENEQDINLFETMAKELCLEEQKENPSALEKMKSRTAKKEEEVDENAEPAKKKSLEQEITDWSIPKKVKAGMMGNKQIRGILLRESNRLVIQAVMKNPGLRDAEVLKIVQSPAVSEEVIRMVTQNKGWMKSYALQSVLAANPKTPLGLAIRLLNNLKVKELKTIAKSKGVPNNVVVAAKKLISQRL